MIVRVKDKEITLKYSFRVFFIFENIMNRSFQPNTTSDVLVFFYSCIMASEKNLEFSFDEFLDMVDEKPELIGEFADFIAEAVKRNKVLQPQSEDEKKTK